MRKAVAVGLGLLVIGSLYLRPLARHPGTLRVAAALLAAALLTAASLQSGPQPTVASKTAPVDPVAVARMATPIVTGYSSRRPVTIDFSRPMDAASVRTALRIEPEAPVSLAWAPNGQSLTITPLGTWQPAVFYTIRVDTSARDQAGRELAEPIETGFFTRSQPSVKLGTLDPLRRGRAGLEPAIQLIFDRPVDVASVRAALKVSPEVPGAFVGLEEGEGVEEGLVTDGFGDRFIWRPSAALRVNTQYTFSLAATVRDREGLTLRAPSTLAFRTAAVPKVVRFRPFAEATAVPRGALVSIRFSQAMDRRSTERAFVMSRRGGGIVRGAFRWAEKDTVLVFDPGKDLAAGSRFDVSLKGSARAATGLQLARSTAIVSAWDFSTAPKPGTRRASDTSGSSSGGSSGGSTGSTGGSTGISSAPWLSVEQYYLSLMNCSRTGGWVQTDGDCIGYGSGKYSTYVRPLTLSSAISSRVARPYAKFLATRGLCSHYADGGPDDRLRRAGFTSYQWGENLGCRSGDPYAAVLASHVYTFQAEANGPVGGTTGHWRNLKNPAFTTAGIGVWVSNGRVRLVIDFYDP